MKSLIPGLFILLLSPAVMADRLVIGVEELNYYPYFTFEDGEYAGHARELLDAFAEDNGYHFDFRPLPVARLLDAFLDGDVDFKYPDDPDWSRDAREGYDIYYSDPVIPYVDGVVASGRLEEPESLATVRGFTPLPYLDQIEGGEVELHEVPNAVQLVRFVISGRAEAAYFNIRVLEYQLEEMGREEVLKFQEHMPHVRADYYLSTLEHQEVVEAFNEWMADNRDLVEEINARYNLD